VVANGGEGVVSAHDVRPEVQERDEVGHYFVLGHGGQGVTRRSVDRGEVGQAGRVACILHQRLKHNAEAAGWWT
jgi:hypothetical protein